ncbi:hypothetical protein LC76P1_00156 [Lysinibacillus phage LC76P1]|nr:hypothetical protein LC76P1_00156 [Lysinibacillus phage LC76P1]
MANKKGTKLTLQDIKENITLLDTLRPFVIDEKTGKYIMYNPLFDMVKVQALLKDLSDHMQYDMTELDGKMFEYDIDVNEYILFLIIKHYSEMGQLLEGQDFKEHLHIFEGIKRNGMYDKFLMEMFDLTEIMKVQDEIQKRLNLSVQLMKVEAETKSELSKKLRSHMLMVKEKENGKKTVQKPKRP